MSLKKLPISNFKFNKNKDKPRNSFPIKIEGFPHTSIGEVTHEQWIVAANGFVIAHFVDETSMHSYLAYLSKFGFSFFPKQILDILEAQHNSGAMKREL